jgi:DNA-binding transcriptional MerR regulator
MQIIEQIKKFLDKKSAQEIVINAESLSSNTGLPPVDIIKMIDPELKNYWLRRAVKLYKQGKPKTVMYKGLFDDMFIRILKIGEDKKIELSNIFSTYQHTREKVNKGLGKIKGAIYEPMFSYIVVSLIGYVALKQFVKNTALFKQMHVDTSLLLTIYHIYWYVILTVLVILVVLLTKFQRKLPLIKKAYKEVDGYNYISLIHILLENGIPSTDITALLKTKKQGAEGIVEFLSQYVKKYEAAVLKYGIETHQYEKITKTLMQRKEDTFLEIIEGVAAGVKQVMFIISIIPLGFVLTGVFYTLFQIMNAISSMA